MRITITDGENVVLTIVEIDDDVNSLEIETAIDEALSDKAGLSFCEACEKWSMSYVEIDGECVCETCAPKNRTEGNDAR